jgi:hypothetical protein
VRTSYISECTKSRVLWEAKAQLGTQQEYKESKKSVLNNAVFKPRKQVLRQRDIQTSSTDEQTKAMNNYSEGYIIVMKPIIYKLIYYSLIESNRI